MSGDEHVRVKRDSLDKVVSVDILDNAEKPVLAVAGSTGILQEEVESDAKVCRR